jgi:hypothetical protein
MPKTSLGGLKFLHVQPDHALIKELLYLRDLACDRKIDPSNVCRIGLRGTLIV